MEGNDRKLPTTEASPQGDIPSLSAKLEPVTTQAMAHPSVSQSLGPLVTGLITTPEVHVSVETGSAQGVENREDLGTLPSKHQAVQKDQKQVLRCMILELQD